jgi:hypothetical protein
MFFSISHSQEKTGGRIHGLVVGDYFYKAGGDLQPYGDSLSQYSRPISKDFQGFELRRIHFYYDYTFSEIFSSRFQIEGNSKSIDSEKRHGFYVKSVYLEWKNLIPQSSLFIGLVPTPTWLKVEGSWGYRSIEKTITDFHGLGSHTDIGVHLKGTLVSDWSMNYSLMIGNGTGLKPENNKYKKYYTSLSGKLIENVSMEMYADYELGANNGDRTTWKASFAYQENSLMMGAEILEQVQNNKDSLHANYCPFGISFFTWYSFSEQYKIFGRIDYYDPNRFSPGTDFCEYFLSLGIDYTPIKDIHIMPNIWINTFTDKSRAGRKKDADVVPRITFYFTFN